jgi:cAMP-dependent protein kinase regulator
LFAKYSNETPQNMKKSRNSTSGDGDFGALGNSQDTTVTSVTLSREEYIGIAESTHLSQNARQSKAPLGKEHIHALQARILGQQDVILLELTRHEAVPGFVGAGSPSSNYDSLLRCMLLWPSSTLFVHKPVIKQAFLGSLSHISDSVRHTCIRKNVGLYPEDIPSSLEELPAMKQDAMNNLQKGATEMLCQIYETGKPLHELFPLSSSSAFPSSESSDKNDIFRHPTNSDSKRRRAETFLCCITTDNEAHFFRTADLLIQREHTHTQHTCKTDHGSNTVAGLLLGSACKCCYLSMMEKARQALSVPYFTIDLQEDVFSQLRKQQEETVPAPQSQQSSKPLKLAKLPGIKKKYSTLAERGYSEMLCTLPSSTFSHQLSPDTHEQMISIHNKCRRRYEHEREGISTSGRALTTIVASRCQSKDESDEKDYILENSTGHRVKRHTRDRSRAMPTKSQVQEDRYERFENIVAKPITLSHDYKPPHFPKTMEEHTFLNNCISDNFIFVGMDKKEKELLIDAMEPLSMRHDAVLCKQGELGDYFYVLADGLISFYIDDLLVGKAHAPAIFGELSLLYDSPRAATCKAETNCEVYRVGQETFKAMMAHNKANAAQHNLNILKMVSIFSDLDMKFLTKISDAMTLVQFHTGDQVIAKGTVGRVFYIIKEGQVSITDVGLGSSSYSDQILGVGEFFGERALLTSDVRAANVTAITDCTMLCLSRESFCRIMGPLEDLLKKALKKRRLLGVPMVAKANLASFEIEQLVASTEELSIIRNETIRFRDGNQGLYFIIRGAVSATNDSGKVVKFRQGDY